NFQALAAAQGGEAAGEVVEVLALRGIDDADAFERNVQLLRELFDPGAVAEQDRRAEPERKKLPRRLQHARLRAFRKNDPLRMALQLFNDVPDKTHARKL